MNQVKFAIGADHAGFDRKEHLKKWLQSKDFIVKDFGTFSLDSVDYPDFAHKVAASVETAESDLGILICGSANGVAMTANKHKNVRAALCWIPEIASLAREHNDANVICIPARYTTNFQAIDILNAFLASEFEGGRHKNRVDKIDI